MISCGAADEKEKYLRMMDDESFLCAISELRGKFNLTLGLFAKPLRPLR